ncbi:MAG: hypothetical protein ACE14S_06935 [Candidatus Bathyarchaeia archaeon]
MAQPETKNVSVQKGFTAKNLIDDMKGCLGYVVSAESGSGKSYLGFTLIREALKPENKTRVLIFSPSTIYNRKFGACENLKLIKVGTSDFSPVVDYDKAEMERIDHGRDTFFLNTDKKYLFKRSLWLEQLLKDDSLNLCFEIHYLNSRKCKTFITECLKMVFEREKQKLEQNPELDMHTLAVLEECQNSYGTYNLNDDSSLEALSILSMARTDCNLHFLAITQRLAETSVKVTERLRLISGLQIGFNSLNRVKAQITPELRDVVQILPKRTFLYVNGKDNPIFQIPEYKFRGKLVQLFSPKPQPQQQQPEKKKNILQKIAFGINTFLNPSANLPQQQRATTSRNLSSDSESEETPIDRDEDDLGVTFEDEDLIEDDLFGDC